LSTIMLGAGTCNLSLRVCVCVCVKEEMTNVYWGSPKGKS